MTDITNMSLRELLEFTQYVSASELPLSDKGPMFDAIEDRKALLSQSALVEYGEVTDGDSDFN